VITPADSAPQPPGQMPASSWDIQAPYAPGEHQPVYTGGDADPGGRDVVAGTPADAVSNAQARYHEIQSDTYGLGSVIGDVMALPEVPAAHSKHLGGDDAGYPS
jgi:hypothetical protein